MNARRYGRYGTGAKFKTTQCVKFIIYCIFIEDYQFLIISLERLLETVDLPRLNLVFAKIFYIWIFLQFLFFESCSRCRMRVRSLFWLSLFSICPFPNFGNGPRGQSNTVSAYRKSDNLWLYTDLDAYVPQDTKLIDEPMTEPNYK